MARPTKDIPENDVKGLKTLIREGMTDQEIADYYDVHRTTISRRLKKMGVKDDNQTREPKN